MKASAKPLLLTLRGVRLAKRSITVDVGLLSGRTTAVKADLNEEVGTLKLAAQTALGIGMGGWWTYLEAVWMGRRRSRLQNGGSLTLHINRAQVQPARWLLLPFFAMEPSRPGVMLANSNVVSVQDQLKVVHPSHSARIRCHSWRRVHRHLGW